jgi:quinoprotein glucose dehydrogenase
MESWRKLTALVLACAVTAASHGHAADPPAGDWPVYGHDPGSTRFSPLAQINRDNVSTLTVAWTFHTGDVSDGKGNRRRSGFEATPIVVDGTLFLTTGFNRIIALDPGTGTQRWAFDPQTELTLGYGDGLINRGVATWLDPQRPAGLPCRRRIYEATLDARLVSIDAATGQPCADFGTGGQVSLTGVARFSRGRYHMTSPPAVIDNLVVVGSSIDDNSRADMPAGIVRAFDARTGALRWAWDPIPPNESEPGADPAKRWRTGAANAWSILAVDPERHLVFVPTGSASPDYFGGLRPGDDKWANSVVALRAATGEPAWGFQLVHHDLWDYDTASGPLLATLTRDGRQVPVVVQGTRPASSTCSTATPACRCFPSRSGQSRRATSPARQRHRRSRSRCRFRRSHASTSRPTTHGGRRRRSVTRAAHGWPGCETTASSRHPACRDRSCCRATSAA